MAPALIKGAARECPLTCMVQPTLFVEGNVWTYFEFNQEKSGMEMGSKYTEIISTASRNKITRYGARETQHIVFPQVKQALRIHIHVVCITQSVGAHYNAHAGFIAGFLRKEIACWRDRSCAAVCVIIR